MKTSCALPMVGKTLLLVMLINGNCAAQEPERRETFSSTQLWSPMFKAERERGKSLRKSLFYLPQPPSNRGELEAEVLVLLKFQSRRNETWVQQIKLEQVFSNWVLGDFVIDDHVHTVTPVAEAILGLLQISGPEIFKNKEKFDRVRPAHFDPRVIPAIQTPSHPAYPSGHSTQAHLLALLLADIEPENSKKLICDAGLIAILRELAGVHYPSDSNAGLLLARAIYANWLKLPSNKKKTQAAKAWWKDNKAEFLRTREGRRDTPLMLHFDNCTLESLRALIIDGKAPPN